MWGEGYNAGGTFQGGLATKLGINHLGFYYGGNLVSGDAGTSDQPINEVTGRGTTWNNSLAVLFGNEGIGGLRLDIMLIYGVTFSDHTENTTNVKTSSSSGHLVTSRQWGKNLGNIIPN